MTSKISRILLSVAASLPIAISVAMAQSQSAPVGRFHHSGVYDETREEFLVYGGYAWNQEAQKTLAASDVWSWDGTTWKLIADTGVHKYVAPMVFDSKRRRILMFGGVDDSGMADGKLYSLDGGAWKLVKDLPSLKRAYTSLAYDSKRDQVMLFSGRDEDLLFSDTWEFDGSDWKPTFVAGPITAFRRGSCVRFSARCDRLHGGFRPGAALGDTWEWSGDKWKLVTESGPGPRSWPGIAYDSKGNAQFSLAARMRKGNSFPTRGLGMARCGRVLQVRRDCSRGYRLRWDTTPYETELYCSAA